MIKRIIFITFIFFISPSIIFSQISDIKEAINKAGRQRMLSQKIAKDYIFIGLEVNVMEAKEEMESSIYLFESQLDELLAFSPNSDIRIEFEKIKFSWAYFKKLTSTSPTKKNAAKVISYCQRLLKESNNAVQTLIKHSRTKSNNLIDVSGKQRMLAQQIALYFAAYTWRVPHRDVIPKFNTARDTFIESLDFLLKNPTNSEEIDLALHDVQKDFIVDKTFQIKKDFPIEEMYFAMNSITSKMNIITQFYEK